MLTILGHNNVNRSVQRVGVQVGLHIIPTVAPSLTNREEYCTHACVLASLDIYCCISDYIRS